MNDKAAAKPLDAAALDRLRELDPDGRHGVLPRILATFETSLTRMLVQLSAQRTNGDAAAVAVIAHTLKSSAGSVGALALSRTCHEVEAAIRDGDRGGLDARVALLLAEGEAALAAVATMLRP